MKIEEIHSTFEYNEKYMQYWARYMNRLEERKRLTLLETYQKYFDDDMFFLYLQTRSKMMQIKVDFDRRQNADTDQDSPEPAKKDQIDAESAETTQNREKKKGGSELEYKIWPNKRKRKFESRLAKRNQEDELTKLLTNTDLNLVSSSHERHNMRGKRFFEMKFSANPELKAEKSNHVEGDPKIYDMVVDSLNMEKEHRKNEKNK